jgi:DNA repair protein RadC
MLIRRRAPTSERRRQSIEAANPLGIAVHDHIIVGLRA